MWSLSTLTARHKRPDRSFESDVERFQKNIYATPKGVIRQAVLEADLAWLIKSEKPLRILDVGGGLGQVSQRFAKSGHHITHTDIAPAMVDEASRLHQQAGLANRYRYIAAPLQQLNELLHGQTFDVVLCHAVMEWLEQPQRCVAQLNELIAPGGWLSLMFYNRNAKAMANLVYGNFDYVAAGLEVKKKVRFSPHHPQTIEQVYAWCLAQNLTLYKHSGVRVIHDYLRERGDQSRDDLITMELAYRTKEPFRQLGRYQHFLLRKLS